MKVWKTLKILGLKMKFCLIMFWMLGLSMSCSRLPEQETLFSEVLSEFAAEMSQEENMFAFGMGGAMSGGAEKNLISEFFLAFSCRRSANITQARSLTLLCMHRLMDKINSFEAIRPYLEHYPYPPSGIGLRLRFCSHEKCDSKLDDQYVDTLFFTRNEIEYQQYEKETEKRITIFIETYEEALERDAQIRQGQQ